jgi:pimeloyl-ACP methyl ester carboxylesterase
MSGCTVAMKAAPRLLPAVVREGRGPSRLRCVDLILAATPRADAILADANTAGDATVDMEYQPAPLPDRAAALAAGLLAAALPPLLRPPAPAGTWRSLAWAAVRLAAAWLAAAYAAGEVRQARRLVEPRAAAYPDSRFLRLPSGLLVHYLEEAPPPGAPAPGPAVVIVHGFGSAAAACRPALRPLARRLGARVVALDMPGFGLTERPRRLADYDAGAVVEALAAALGLGARGEGLLLVGHSLGGLVAARLAADPASHVTALALVAPALAPPPAPAPPPAAPPPRWARAAAACRRAAAAAGLYLLQAALGLAAPLVAAVLRRAVYRGAFWRQGLAAAYGGGARPADATVEDYRRASRVRGWDRGLVRFVRFRVAGGRGLWDLVRDAWRGPGGGEGEGGEGGLVGRLRAAGRPVLIVHGAEDRIIPVANSRALAAALAGGAGGCVLRELRGCGHCPLEQAPGDVVDAVAAFVASLPPPPPISTSPLPAGGPAPAGPAGL